MTRVNQFDDSNNVFLELVVFLLLMLLSFSLLLLLV